MKSSLMVLGCAFASLCDPTPSPGFTVTHEPLSATLAEGSSISITLYFTCSSLMTLTIDGDSSMGLELTGGKFECSQEPNDGTLTLTAGPGSATSEGFVGYLVSSNQEKIEPKAYAIAVTVTRGGSLDVAVVGRGRVTSVPSGIDCGSTCSAVFPQGTAVVLTPVAVEPDVFVQWALDPDCADGSVTVGAAPLHCEARFAPQGTGWVPMGAPLNVTAADAGAYVGGVALERAADGQPLAAWVEGDALRVAKWSGTAWVPLGTPLNTRTVSSPPTLAFTLQSEPVIAWDEDDGLGMGGHDAFVATFDGSSWHKLGAAPIDVDVAEDATAPSVRLTPMGLVAAWSERVAAGGSRIVVRRWSGTQWVNAGTTLGPAMTPGEESFDPKLAVTGTVTNASLAVAWSQQGSAVRVAELGGGTVWNTLSPDPFTQLSISDYAFTTRQGAGPMVAVAPQGVGTFQVVGWNGAAWTNLGAPRGMTATGALILHVSLSHSIGVDPLLAWTYRLGGLDQVLVERWSAGAWGRLADPIPSRNRQGSDGWAFAVQVSDGLTPAVLEVVNGHVGAQTDHTVRVLELR